MKQIPLTQGKVALVDDDIYEVVKNYKWYAWKHYNTYYAIRNVSRKLDPEGKQQKIRLHHTVIGKPPKDFMVDHIDGNGLNNQRSNIRIATNRINQANQGRHRKGSLVGATWHKRDKKWMARIEVDGILKHLGYFDTEQEAHEVYKRACR